MMVKKKKFDNTILHMRRIKFGILANLLQDHALLIVSSTLTFNGMLVYSFMIGLDTIS